MKENLQEEFYNIEKILGRRKHNGIIQYKIKWEGYPISQCTWEPMKNLETAKELVEEYDRTHPITLYKKQGKSEQKKKDKNNNLLSQKRKLNKDENENTIQENTPNEIIHDDELCKFIHYFISIIYDTFSSSIQSLVVKTDAIPKNLFQDYDKEKILKFILSTEIEFKKFSSKIQPFASAFGGWLWFVIEKDSFDLWRLLFDICSNPLNGNYKYKISKSIFKDENNEEKEYDMNERENLNNYEDNESS